MTRPYTLSKQVYACRCGQEHPQLTRLAGVPVLLCPECPDDALHVHIDRVGGVRIVTGEVAVYHRLEEAWAKENATISAKLDVIGENLGAALARLDALEAKMNLARAVEREYIPKRGAKE